MTIVYLAFGSNLGDRKQYIEDALEVLNQAGVECKKRSSFYETEPVGTFSQPLQDVNFFLNAAAEFFTVLKPSMLLSVIQKIENDLGRTRKSTSNEDFLKPHESRTIDIDLLFYDDLILKMPQLEIPHPRIAERRFVLEPLAEIAPNFIHPVYEKTILELLGECDESGCVQLLV